MKKSIDLKMCPICNKHSSARKGKIMRNIEINHIPKIGKTIPIYVKSQNKMIAFKIEKIYDNWLKMVSLDLKIITDLSIDAWYKQREMLEREGYYDYDESEFQAWPP